MWQHGPLTKASWLMNAAIAVKRGETDMSVQEACGFSPRFAKHAELTILGMNIGQSHGLDGWLGIP